MQKNTTENVKNKAHRRRRKWKRRWQGHMRLNQILVHHQHHLILIDLDIFNLHTLVNIPVTSLCNSHDYTINIQVSAVADGPARRLSYACPCSTQRWTISDVHWPTVGRLFIAHSVNRFRTKVDRRLYRSTCRVSEISPILTYPTCVRRPRWG